MIIDSPLNCSDNISLWKENDKMTCSSCQFLNETRKKDGAVSGAIYFCAKKNKYVYGNAQYYVIENDLKEFYDDFVIYINEENYISIERKKILDIYYIDFIIKFLKKENYEYITFIIPTYEEKIIDRIKENYKRIEEKNIMQSNWEYKKIKLYLN